LEKSEREAVTLNYTGSPPNKFHLKTLKQDVRAGSTLIPDIRQGLG